MKPHTFHILCVLAAGDAHGSGIARAVERQTDGAVRLWPVTLYRTLDELVDEGLIVEIDGEAERPAGASGRSRYYRLTDSGARELQDEAERLDRVARAALRDVAEGSWRR